jgi:hypothetical protein
VGALVEAAGAGSGDIFDGPIRIVASDDVRTFVRLHGGSLYVWTVAHYSPRATITLLETATAGPLGRTEGFVRIGVDDFDLYFDSGGHGWPEELVLELKWWRQVVRAYWNNCAYVF